ncbi:MAG: hypothetical protein KatS3mg005_0925 [Bryobacteraceae bacterium]|nr:MAG: hypothetical protein KatS3mg005_0925 [Bryobacteraceae bacterium]
MTRSAIAMLVLAACSMAAEAVPPGRALAVEHAVPFGQIQGKLILYADYLVFVDEAQPADSFVAPKASIESLSADGAMITVQLKDAVRNRSGEVRRLSFRALDGDPGPVTSWFGSGGAPAAAPASSAAAQSVPEGAKVFPASHNHRIGSCSGRLLITADRLSYESTDAVSHSRRWELKQIRDISLPNPYELNVRAFGEGNYKIRLEGSGMDPQTYKELVDRITAARALK